jgi:hypothetical protein
MRQGRASVIRKALIAIGVTFLVLLGGISLGNSAKAGDDALVSGENYPVDAALFCTNTAALKELARLRSSGDNTTKPNSCYQTSLVFQAEFKVPDVTTLIAGKKAGFIAGWTIYEGKPLRVYVAFEDSVSVVPRRQ